MDESVHRQLAGGACTSLADPDHPLRNRGQDGLCAGHQLRGPSGHDRQGTRFDGGHAPRNRAIKEERSGAINTLPHRDDRRGIDRAGFDGHGSGLDAGEDPVGPQIDRLHRLIIGQAGQNEICSCGGRRWGVHHPAAGVRSHRLGLGPVAVPQDRRETRPGDTAGHGPTHPPETRYRNDLAGVTVH